MSNDGNLCRTLSRKRKRDVEKSMIRIIQDGCLIENLGRERQVGERAMKSYLLKGKSGPNDFIRGDQIYRNH